MNLINRLQKLESAILPDSDLCQCPDAIVWGATQYWSVCYQCGKRIDLKTWETWTMILPTEEHCNFAFGLARTTLAEAQV